MFTGIVQSTARIISSKKREDLVELSIQLPKGWQIKKGQSIAVNGACLTVEQFNKQSFTVSLMPETLGKTAFGEELPKDVNLEQAMPATGRFEGHFVQGHIDAVGKVLKVNKNGESSEITIKIPNEFSPLVVDKGSIAVDGTSLTIIKAVDSQVTIGLIPFTLANTTLGSLTPGVNVNLEFDMIGKYISKQLGEK